jgi:hypothetical protein
MNHRTIDRSGAHGAAGETVIVQVADRIFQVVGQVVDPIDVPPEVPEAGQVLFDVVYEILHE